MVRSNQLVFIPFSARLVCHPLIVRYMQFAVRMGFTLLLLTAIRFCPQSSFASILFVSIWSAFVALFLAEDAFSPCSANPSTLSSAISSTSHMSAFSSSISHCRASLALGMPPRSPTSFRSPPVSERRSLPVQYLQPVHGILCNHLRAAIYLYIRLGRCFEARGCRCAAPSLRSHTSPLTADSWTFRSS